MHCIKFDNSCIYVRGYIDRKLPDGHLLMITEILSYYNVTVLLPFVGSKKVGVGGRELIDTDDPRRGSASSSAFRVGSACSNHASINR